MNHGAQQQRCTGCKIASETPLCAVCAEHERVGKIVAKRFAEKRAAKRAGDGRRGRRVKR